MHNLRHYESSRETQEIRMTEFYSLTEEMIHILIAITLAWFHVSTGMYVIPDDLFILYNLQKLCSMD